MSNEKIIIWIEDEDVLELLPGYLESCRADLGILQNSTLKMNSETVRILGHSLKGSGGGFGLERISEIGKKLEISSQIHDWTSIGQEIAALSEFLNCVEIVGT